MKCEGIYIDYLTEGKHKIESKAHLSVGEMGHIHQETAEFEKVRFNTYEKAWEKEYIQFCNAGVSKINFITQ